MKWNEYLLEFLEWIQLQNEVLIWIFFFLSNLLENVFPPWPGDTVTVFGGFYIGHTFNESGGFGIWGLISSTILGNLAGAWIMYKFGHRFLNFIRHREFPFKEELYDEEKIHSTFSWFHRHAVLVIVLSRFSAGIRFFVSIVAGMVRMNFLLFAGLFTLAVILWCGLLIYAGYSVGQNWDIILEYLEIYNRIVLFLILLFVLFGLTLRWILKQK